MLILDAGGLQIRQSWVNSITNAYTRCWRIANPPELDFKVFMTKLLFFFYLTYLFHTRLFIVTGISLSLSNRRREVPS